MPFVAALLKDEPTDSKLLFAAKQCLEGGWTQLAYRDDTGHCVVSALAVACGNHLFRWPTQQERRLMRLLSRELPFHLGRSFLPTRWRLMSANDSRTMTQEQILGMLERAIAHQLTGTKKSNAFQRLWSCGIRA